MGRRQIKTCKPGDRPESNWESLKIQISSQLLRCEKIFLLTYITYVALRKFLRALHLGEL
jgi:hypothetical protein